MRLFNKRIKKELELIHFALTELIRREKPKRFWISKARSTGRDI
jgi:hypothetical protein